MHVPYGTKSCLCILPFFLHVLTRTTFLPPVYTPPPLPHLFPSHYTVDVRGTHTLQKVKQHGLKKIKKVGKLSKKLLKTLKKKTGKKLTEELRPLLQLETLSSDSDGEAGRLKEVKKQKKQKSKGMKSVQFEDDIVQLLKSDSADDSDVEVEVSSTKGKRKTVSQDGVKWAAERTGGATKRRKKGGRKQVGGGGSVYRGEEEEDGFGGKKEKEREARRARRAKKKVKKYLVVQCQDSMQCFNLHSKP